MQFLTRAARRVLLPATSPLRRVGCIRHLNIHEHHSLKLMRDSSVRTVRGNVAYSPKEAAAVASTLGKGIDYVVKAQVLAGGRGKGRFDSGLEGGVQFCNSVEAVEEISKQMIGSKLVTKQTGEEGRPCNAVFVTERLFLRRESYFAILMDREFGGPVMVGSPKGGMDIEAVAAETPQFIFKQPVPIDGRPTSEQLFEMAVNLGFDSSKTQEQAAEIFDNLYSLFLERDCTLVEINPLAETHDGKVLCADAKLNFDDNASFRQTEVFQMHDTSQIDPREVVADDVGLNYIGLDGNIGCLVNGAGLAMATMDVIKLHGGEPANFLDLGGGASEKQVSQAFSLLNDDPSVSAVLVNIFGGIMKCDVIALGLINAAATTGLSKPLVVRLAGTNVDEAKRLIDESGFRMMTADDLGEAAQKVVRVANIVKMAKEANVNVSFELPL